MANYQLFGDNTVLVLVDGKSERRKYSLENVSPLATIVVPQTVPGEQIVRDRDGNIEIMTSK